MRAVHGITARGAAPAPLLVALLLALALGGAHAVDCEYFEVPSYAPVVNGLRLEGPETTYACGDALTYADCFRACTCNRRKAGLNSSHPDCTFVNYWASHARCGGRALCQQLTKVTRPVPEAGVRSGLGVAASPLELDVALGLWLGRLGAWIEAEESMLITRNSCNTKATYEECQRQCLLNAKCVAWMHGIDGDWACTSPLQSCPNKPLKGCKRGYCLLYAAFYAVNEWQATDDTGHPGNWVGVIPGRANSALGKQPDPRGAPMNTGDMYVGAVEAEGVSRPAAAGVSLPTLAFDYGGAVGRSACDAAGNCAHNLACDLFVATAAECSALCEASNDKSAVMLSALLARSDVNRGALEAAGAPTCKFYRWTAKALACGPAGLKKGECLLLSKLTGVRARTAQDNSLGRVYGVLDMSDLPRSPPPSPSPRPPPPAPPPPEPPVVVTLDIGVGGTTKQQFGPAKQQHVEAVLEQNSGGGATASIASITDVPAVGFAQQRTQAAAGGIVLKVRLAYRKRDAAKAARFARQVAAGGVGTAWVRQISPNAAVDCSSVRLQGQQVLLPPPPSPAPPLPVRQPTPPPRSINDGSGRGGGRPGGGGSVRPRAAMEVEAAAALAAAPCSSVFFSLPKLLVGDTPHLAAFSDASPEANAAWALAYCQQRDASFGAAGTVRGGVLPAALAAHATAVLTYSQEDDSTCIGRDCPFVAVVECVPAGVAPCAADAQGNVGVGNTGWHNVGHYNSGSGNLGSRNSGSRNMGDMNTASGCVGSFNTADGSFGYEASGSLVPPALQR